MAIFGAFQLEYAAHPARMRFDGVAMMPKITTPKIATPKIATPKKGRCLRWRPTLMAFEGTVHSCKVVTEIETIHLLV